MKFKLLFSESADISLTNLEKDKSKAKQLKAVRKRLAYLSLNPRHPSLNTHKYESLSRELGIEVFEAYAENKTSGAYRIFWYYGTKGTIIVIAITPHPQELNVCKIKK